MIYPFLSAHATPSLLFGYRDDWEEPLFLDQSNWLHARLFAKFHEFFFDFGPGVAWLREYQDLPGDRIIKETRRLDYFRVVSSLIFFWKLGAWLDARYIFPSSESGQDLVADDLRLPTQSLFEAPTLSAENPDTLTSSTFIGARNALFGLSIGWRQFVRMLDVSDETQVERSQGIGIYYEHEF